MTSNVSGLLLIFGEEVRFFCSFQKQNRSCCLYKDIMHFLVIKNIVERPMSPQKAENWREHFSWQFRTRSRNLKMALISSFERIWTKFPLHVPCQLSDHHEISVPRYNDNKYKSGRTVYKWEGDEHYKGNMGVESPWGAQKLFQNVSLDRIDI